MWEYLMEEQFFFKYHLKCSREEFRSYPINERKWMIARYLQQKEKEQDYLEKQRAKKKG